MHLSITPLAILLRFALPAEAAEKSNYSLVPYSNPILPGWNSDPSCIFVPEYENTYFCVTSSFLAFPGIPIYASKDLLNWKLASNAYADIDQLPDMLRPSTNEQEGITAVTLRYYKGCFYVITNCVNWGTPKEEFIGFKTKDPFTDTWSGPVIIPSSPFTIDPDLFWDDDGQAYIASAGIRLQKVDLETGESDKGITIWEGEVAEGPHIYKKDGWYYLLLAEGGTELGHMVTIARSKKITGPYNGYSKNPILTNRNTTQYFQTVGHADLFQDKEGNWWGAALSTRSGPEWQVYPMGRETVLFPVKWEKGQWPVLQPVRGRMIGPLPLPNTTVPGSGPWVGGADKEEFKPGHKLPRHWVHWRPPPRRHEDYTVSPPYRPNTLALRASRANLTTDKDYLPTDGITFVGRRQTHTYFEFSIDLSLETSLEKAEAGISVFLTSRQHIDLSIINLPDEDEEKGVRPHIRLNTVAYGNPTVEVPKAVSIPLPKNWSKSVRLHASAKNDTRFEFWASNPSNSKNKQYLGSITAAVTSGSSGRWTGTILGGFATTNGGKKPFHTYISRWRYTPVGQKIFN